MPGSEFEQSGMAYNHSSQESRLSSRPCGPEVQRMTLVTHPRYDFPDRVTEAGAWYTRKQISGGTVQRTSVAEKVQLGIFKSSQIIGRAQQPQGRSVEPVAPHVQAPGVPIFRWEVFDLEVISGVVSRADDEAMGQFDWIQERRGILVIRVYVRGVQ